MVDKALAEVQKGVQLSSLCLPSSTPLNINAALIPPKFMATLIVYRFFLMKALTFCLCSYTSPSLSSRPCSLHRSLSLASLRPGWLSPRWCKGTDTESVQSGILGSSFLAEDKEGPQCLCSGCDPACTGPCVGSSVLVSPVPGCLAPWACLKSCLP